MKKVIALLSIVALVSCGGGESTDSTSTDSTVVKADTSAVVVDSTKTESTEVIVDSTK